MIFTAPEVIYVTNRGDGLDFVLGVDTAAPVVGTVFWSASGKPGYVVQVDASEWRLAASLTELVATLTTAGYMLDVDALAEVMYLQPQQSVKG